jgi:hypothetical protein
MVVWIAVALLDPRVRGFRPFAGGYERDARVAVEQVEANLATNTANLLGGELSYAFFGQKWAPGLTQVVSVLLIASSLLLFRINPLWMLLVLLTVAVTLVMKPVPRYFVMILPLLALGWLLLLTEIGRRLGPKGFVAVMLLGIGITDGMNVARSVKVIAEQRTGERLVDGPKWKSISDISRKIREVVPAGEKVIAPNASIVHYLSGREAVTKRDIIPPGKSAIHWPRFVRAAKIDYAVFPPRLYDEAETPIRQLMDRGVIVPIVRVAYVDAQDEPMVLAKIEIREPPPGKDWRKNPTTAPMTARTTVTGTTRPSAAQLARKRRHQAAARHAIAEAKRIKQERIARAERLEKQQRKLLAEKKEARERKARKARHAQAKAAATQPATTQPASTQPAGASGIAPLIGGYAAFEIVIEDRRAPFKGDRERREGAKDNAKFDQAVSLRVGLRAFAVAVSSCFDFDVGGLSGQSVASRRDSICCCVNFREPWFIPWHRLAALSQFSRLASTPSQNGQVRHWSGRTSYTEQTRLTAPFLSFTS